MLAMATSAQVARTRAGDSAAGRLGLDKEPGINMTGKRALRDSGAKSNRSGARSKRSWEAGRYVSSAR